MNKYNSTLGVCRTEFPSSDLVEATREEFIKRGFEILGEDKVSEAAAGCVSVVFTPEMLTEMISDKLKPLTDELTTDVRWVMHELAFRS